MHSTNWNIVLTKKIETLIEDVQAVLLNGAELTDEQAAEFGRTMASMIQNRLKPADPDRKNGLRMSNIGSPCVKKLYGEINHPDEREPLTADTKLKFLYGDMIEELMLFLASVSGHTVNGRQGEQHIEGITGHRDAIIDGTLVDVKSASSYSFQKFKTGKLREDDAFGYYTQIQSYLHASQNDPELLDKSRAAFWVIDKTLGHQCLDFHEKEEFDFGPAYQERIATISADSPPNRSFEPIEDGYNKKEKDGTTTFIPNGNMKLDMFCSYCSVKQWCHPGLRTFLSARGPVYYTEVRKEPKMTEVDGNGNVIEKTS
jgi:hypothetical protein